MIPCRRLVEAPVTALDERKEPLGGAPTGCGRQPNRARMARLRRPQGRPERIIVLSVRRPEPKGIINHR
ncbi:hypothetical protein SAMN02745177_01083 [Desulforamulus hydrothermalis Lam5 = DSM 18033]|nr:hypothetical protein SAMN02745177_01083 [Desulforamulus hydrothermalis Lam5 = DSM 18033]